MRAHFPEMESSSSSTVNNKRIAKNTLFLYFRMILVMLVTLYTSRIILNALGINDYGIYNVVGGVVSLFAVISNSLSSAISRFLTFELGTSNHDRLKRIFATSLSIQLSLALTILILCGTIGYWFLNHRMNIEASRMVAANWVFLFSLLTFSVNLISVPYNALLIAHERMKAFAYVGILEVTLKLGATLLLLLATTDRLILYAVLIFLVSLIIRVIYGTYCNKHFTECRTRPIYDARIFREMSRFAGWNFIGSAGSIIRDQGNNILLNLFFGTVVNAAYALGMQVSNAIYSFSQNFMTALNPQIIKSYAQGERDQLMSLVYRGARFSFFLLWFIACILLLNTRYILSLWLTSIPEYTIRFVRLFVLFVVSESISQPLITAQLATGDIKNYQLGVGGLKLLNLPLSYLCLKKGLHPYITLEISIAISIAMLLLRLYFLKRMIQLKAGRFFSQVIVKVLLVGSFSFGVSYLLTRPLPETFGFLIIKTSITLLIVSVSILLLGCTPNEQLFLWNKLNTLKKRIRI